MREPVNHYHHHSKSAPQSGQWESSPEGIAYLEFNHALAGVGIILMGLSELHMPSAGKLWLGLGWVGWLLPVSLIGSGIFLIIWSDYLAGLSAPGL